MVNSIFDSDKELINVSTRLACVIGLNEAIIIHKLNDLIQVNSSNEYFNREGRVWIRCSARELKEKYFPFWSLSTIKRSFANLEKGKLIKVATFNEGNLDVTKWYTIDEEKVLEVVNSIGSDCTNEGYNKSVQNELMDDNLLKELEYINIEDESLKNASYCTPKDLSELFKVLDFDCL